MQGPLAGLKVADFSTHISGPLASQLLIQLGATVFKIENPRTGDGLRGLRPMINGSGLLHVALNSGTYSLAIDHRSSHWRQVTEACARWADVVIIGLRPEVAVKRGLDFGTIAKLNSRLIYCALTGYGEKGPWRSFLAHGLNVDASAGLVPIEWIDDQPQPIASHQSIGVPLAGVFAALGIVAALRNREKGTTYVHVSLWETAMWFSWRHATAYWNGADMWPSYREFGSRYAMYRTLDSRAILVCPIERRSWESFCDALSLPGEWRNRGQWDVSGMDLGYERADERTAIAKSIGKRSLEEWTEILSSRSIPFSPVVTISEAFAGEHARSLDLALHTRVGEKATDLPSSPIRVAATPSESRTSRDVRPPPGLGENTRDILTELGLPRDLLATD